MTLKIKEKEYEQFTPRERLNLAIAAMARNDQDELDRLWRNCKVELYRARDLAYKELFCSFAFVCTRFFERCVYFYSQIIKCTCLLLMKTDKTELDRINKTQNVYIAQLKSVYAGLREFCNMTGLNVDDVLSTTHMEDRFEDINVYLEFEIEPDTDMTEEVKEELLSYWHSELMKS